MSLVDSEGNIKSIAQVDKFIEIEFNKADEKGQVCFIQVASEPGFLIIVGIKIGVSQFE
jgi:hypothetical protein